MAKGKGRRIEEQKETRNFATHCKICKLDFSRENGLYDHKERIHPKDGFVCDNCKVCVSIEEYTLHGEGLCLKVGNVKARKQTKKEKKLKKESRPSGYVVENTLS